MEPLNPKDVTVLWHGWLKKLGRFSKRWRRRYFIFLSTANGMKELRHYDAQKELLALLASTPKGVIAMTDATGICCFLPPSPSAVAARKHTVFNLIDSHDTTVADIQDQKFAVLTPLVSRYCIPSLNFEHSGREWASASESQQGLSLLASLSAFYPAVDVLHSSYMSKKRERTVHSTAKNSIISYWKRHFFVFLSSGDLLYFRDETLSELQGRVDVRHAPTVRVTGERMLEEHKKKEIGALLLKLTKRPGGVLGANDRESCLVWIATPPSKMFVLKVQEDNDGVTTDGKRQELTPASKKWLSLLLQGHAETKYTQLEQCVSMGKYDATPEIVSAVRAGIPDELRGALWKGFSGATDLQRRAELKRTIRKVSKTTSIKSLMGAKDSAVDTKASAIITPSFFDELSGPIDMSTLHVPEHKMIFSRLCAIAMYEMSQTELGSAAIFSRDRRDTSGGDSTEMANLPTTGHASDEQDDALSDSETPPSKPNVAKGHSLKQVGKSKMGHYVYPSDAAAPEWETSARRRLLIATSRFNLYSHPCPWKVACLLLAYLDEDSAFWVINSLQDVYLPGYFHGYRPALQVDIAAFSHVLEERAPTLVAHLRTLSFPVDRTVERWFLSLFTATAIPLPTVLRIWDAFFAQGVRIFFGVGVALFLRAEDNLFRAKSASEVVDILSAAEQTSIDADALFSHAFKDDLNISWLSEERFDQVRSRYRQRVTDQVAVQLELFKDKVGILSQLQDQLTRLLSTIQRLLASVKRSRQRAASTDNDGVASASSPLYSPFRGGDQRRSSAFDDDLDQDEDDALSLEMSLVTLQGCLKSAASAVAKLTADLNSRQARWLALSSQLAGCPLSHGAVRLTSDLQSWLTQVKEGKVSGAGLDALPDEGRHGSASDGANHSGFASAMADQQELFFDPATGTDADKKRSCLVAYKDAFSPGDRFTTETFLEAVVSMLKAACATRLECLAAANRFDWHGGRWLQSPVEFVWNAEPSGKTTASSSTSASASSRGLRRSVSNAGKPLGAAPIAGTPNCRQRNPRSVAVDDLSLPYVATTRTSLDDSVLRRRQGNEVMLQNLSSSYALTPVHEKPLMPSVASPPRGLFSMGASTSIYMQYAPFSSLSSSPSSSSASPSSAASPMGLSHHWLTDLGGDSQQLTSENTRALEQLSKQYRQSDHVLHSAVDSIMSCLSRFIRVESSTKSTRKWELRDRALVLEDDLIQELKAVEAITQSAQSLY